MFVITYMLDERFRLQTVIKTLTPTDPNEPLNPVVRQYGDLPICCFSLN